MDHSALKIEVWDHGFGAAQLRYGRGRYKGWIMDPGCIPEFVTALPDVTDLRTTGHFVRRRQSRTLAAIS
jgi:hypothetical protein